MHHKAREMLGAQRTQLINALRGHLAEMRVITAQGRKNARKLTRVILAEGDETIPACVAHGARPAGAATACSGSGNRVQRSNRRRDGSRRRNGAPPDDHSRLGPGDGLGDGRQRSGHLRFLRPARVRRLSWPDAGTKLVRRQGAAGPRLEDGQPIFAEIARRGRACGSLSSQVARSRHAILGEEASPSRSCAARQPIAQLRRNDRRHRQRPRAAKRIEGDQEVCEERGLISKPVALTAPSSAIT